MIGALCSQVSSLGSTCNNSTWFSKADVMFPLPAKNHLPSEILHAGQVHLLECSTAAPSALEQ